MQVNISLVSDVILPAQILCSIFHECYAHHGVHLSDQPENNPERKIFDKFLPEDFQ